MDALRRFTFIVFPAVLLAASSGTPRVRVAVEGDAFMVRASDDEGLASLAIQAAAEDMTYQTQIAGSQVERTFRRRFALDEVFPDSAGWKLPVRLAVTVRNTRGAEATASIVIKRKGT